MLCEKTPNGIPCNNCHLRAILADCNKWTNELGSSFNRKEDLIDKLEKAELRFDDAIELIVDRQHKVIYR